MRIALVIEQMDTALGGRETSTAQIAAALSGRGHEVTILCQRGSWQCDGVEVVQLGRRSLRRAARLRNFVADVREAAGERNFDVVHAMLPVPGAGIYQPRGGTAPGRQAAGARRRSILAHPGAWLAGRLNTFRRETARLERQVMEDPGVLCLAVSQMVAGEFEKYYRRTDRARVVYNGVNVPAADSPERADWRQRLRFRLGAGKDSLVFMIAAKNFPLKGVREAIIAFSRWFRAHHGQPDAYLLVVGRDLFEGYERLAGLRDVGSRVMFQPYTDQVFQCFAAADVCVLLSWYDPCSRTVLEATRWGIPSITTAYNGAAEVLADGAGFVVASPNDTRGVVAAMDELADPQRRARCAAACLQKADQLTIERHVDELLAAYSEVARRS